MKKRSKTDAALLVTVGDVIKAVRISRGMSQEKVAFLCESNKSAICRIETGRSNPKVLTIKRIADILHVSVAELLTAIPQTTFL